MSERPRLSTRLLLGLYGEEPLAAQEVQPTNTATKPTTGKNKDGSFTVDRFLPRGHAFSAEDAQKIREAFKAFAAAVNTISRNSLLHANAAGTLFNICTKRDSQQQAFKDATGYFGTIEKKVFDQLSARAIELARLSDPKRLLPPATEFRIDFELQPSSLDFSSVESMLQQLPTTTETNLQEDVISWLQIQCESHVQLSGHVMSGSQLYEEVTRIILSPTADNEASLQMALFDLIGEMNIDLISAILQKSQAIANAVNQQLRVPQGGKGNNKGSAAATAAATNWESLSANQRRKLQLKEQREVNKAIEASYEGAQGEGQQGGEDWLRSLGFDEDYLQQERALGLQKNRNPQESWKEGLMAEGSRVFYEQRGLPAGTTRKNGPGYEEVFIPAAPRPPPPAEGELVNIDMLEPWARPAFEGTKQLNRIQSKVFNCAYTSFENMLVCAPTGAGKTNIAMLALLQLIRQHVRPVPGSEDQVIIDKDNFKAIYIAPMKALAQEVVTKFSERLKPLGLVVKEYTGDMQLSKAEIAEAQLLVATPEKYDVSTRKGHGEGSLGSLINLIIIDEVHLLADERGAVIETIVARTQRYVETSQRLVRIVGLSATLPNYADVASFLRVNPTTGSFFFGPEYRPVPLDQGFIGVTEKNRVKRSEIMTKVAFDKVVDALKRGKQVLIFVHSRRDTSKTILSLLELANNLGLTDMFQVSRENSERYGLWKRSVDKSRSQELQLFFEHGCGIHHAGLLRTDRSLSEQLFEQGLVRVLCATATLAWGVNLPAHTVLIKGTEMYDPERGGFVDIGMLDVLQIFGRAGRPQYDNTGHAVLITAHENLNNYLMKLSHQAPIESALIKALADHMNAEIVNGTINNLKEAAAWLSYTFLFVRMKRNPLAYGMKQEEIFADPQLHVKRMELVKTAAETLDRCMMVRFDRRSGGLGVTDLGRIASHYYLRHTTVEGFNQMLNPVINEKDALHVLCSATEFDSLKMRPEEMVEVDRLQQKHTFVKVKVAADDTAGKVNVLLQAGCLSRARIDSFTLQSDCNYVTQNAGRIARALFEICLKKGWSLLARYYLALAKSIDKRIRPDQSPLRQFDAEIPTEALQRLEINGATYNKLLDMTAGEIGQMAHNQKLGGRLKELVYRLPMLAVDCLVQPISRGILRLAITLKSAFEWQDRYHGHAEAFWIWVEDSDAQTIYHAEHFVLQRKERNDEKKIEVVIPVRDPLPPQYYIRVLSDMWVGCELLSVVSFRDLIMPLFTQQGNQHTNLLNLHPIAVKALKDPAFESLYQSHFSHFNPLQSQMFHVLYHTDKNVLVGAPTGSGKTIVAELAILRLLKQHPRDHTSKQMRPKIVYVAPQRALARERLLDWQRKLGGAPLYLSVLELTGEVTPSAQALRNADILVVTPEKWDGISRYWQRRSYVAAVRLVIIDEIHLLGGDRGPVLEVLVSRMRFIAAQTRQPHQQAQTIRFIGLSTALANAGDLADWLGVEPSGLFNFRPSVRPVPMTIHIMGFSGKHYCPRMATMNKPAFAAILEHSPTKPTLIFVASRRQTRLTALDLIALCAADDEPKRFLHMPEEEVEAIAMTIRDQALKDCLVFGIGLHHAGLDASDRAIVEKLFLTNAIQVLIATQTVSVGVNLPCHLVIIKGTEYFDGKAGGYVDFPVTDVLQMMGRAGRPQFDDSAVAVVFVQETKKAFYRKFLHEPFPVESSLPAMLPEALNAEIATGAVHAIVDCMDYLAWSFYFRRLLVNPAYYGLEGEPTPERIHLHLLALTKQAVTNLLTYGCVETDEVKQGDDKQHLEVNSMLKPTFLGRVCSVYYLSHRTPRHFHDGLKRIAARFAEKDRSPESNAQLLLALLKLQSEAPEYSEMPVRHNEDILNGELAEVLDLQPPVLGSLSSPHTKTLLLLAAHCQGKVQSLPIADYKTDLRSVMEQSPRLLSGLVDVAADLGFARVTLAAMHLSQRINRAFPIYGQAAVTAMQRQRGGGGGGGGVRVAITAFAAGEANDDEASLTVIEVNESNPAIAFMLPRDAECRIEARLSVNRSSDSGNDHGKGGGWWAMISNDNEEEDELLALKRVAGIDDGKNNMQSNRSSNNSNHILAVSLVIHTPDKSGKWQLMYRMVSDSLHGRDIGIPVVINVY